MKIFISGLALTISLGLAVLAAPVDVDPLPSNTHLEFDRSPHWELALEHRAVKAPVPTILAEMVPPTKEQLTETEATEEDRQNILGNLQHLLKSAYQDLKVPQNVQVQVSSMESFKHVPKPSAKLLFKAKVPGLSNVCGGVCIGAMVFGSSEGKINNGEDGHLIYESSHFGSLNLISSSSGTEADSEHAKTVHTS